jgi:propionate CoA-transferase
MPFKPIVKNGVRRMDPAIFAAGPMHLKARLLELPLVERVAYDAGRDMLFLNFEGLAIRSRDDLAAMRDVVASTCDAIGHRVPVVVNYDAFTLDGDLEAEYAQVVREMEDRYYTHVSRFTTGAFMRVKLARVLTRTVRPHLFETRSEAQAFHERRG